MPESHTPFSRMITGEEKHLGDGFTVRRILPNDSQTMVGPWIFFDHMGPAEFPAGKGIQVRPHPHINLATVTYLFEGEISHRDSLGSHQIIKPGDVNLMVAGRGITHSERTAPETQASGQRLHGLQLWLALPEADEETDPAFYHYAASDMPKGDVNGVAVRVIIGSAYGLTSPVKTFSETLYVEAQLQPNQTLTLPDAQELAVYVAQGEVHTSGGASADQTISAHTMAILPPGNNSKNNSEGNAATKITARTQTQLAIIGGEALGERHKEWNFVSSRPERIEQAKADWQAQRFPKVVGDEVEFIPLP